MPNEVVTHLKTKDDTTKELNRMEGVFRSFGNNVESRFKSVGLAIAGAFSVAAIGNFARSSVQAFSEAEQAEAKYVAMRKANNEATGISIEQMKQLAAEIQATTKNEDDHVVAVAATMLKYENLTQDVFPRAIKLATDMSEIFGSLEGAATQVGKALNDPANASRILKMAGVELSEEIRTQIKLFKEQGDIAGAQNLVFQELEKRFGGLGEAMGNTMAGRMAKLNNIFGDIKENIGAGLVPAIEGTLPLLEEFAKRFRAAMNVPNESIDKRESESKKGVKGGVLSNVMGGFANFGVSMEQFGIDTMQNLGFVEGKKQKHLYEGLLSGWARSFGDTLAGREQQLVEVMLEREKQVNPPAKPSAGKGPAALLGPDPFAAPEEDEDAAKAAEKSFKDAMDAEDDFYKWIAEEQEKRKKAIQDRLDAQRKSDDEFWDMEAKKTEEERKNRDDGSFQASIEGMMDVSRRIQTAAASNDKPEDKIIKANKEEAAKMKEQMERAADGVAPLAEKLDKLPQGIADKMASETGLA